MNDKAKEEVKKEVKLEQAKEAIGAPKDAVSMNSITPITPVVANNAGDAPQPPMQLAQSIEGPDTFNERITGRRWNPKTNKLENAYENDHKRKKAADAKKAAEKQNTTVTKNVEAAQKAQEKQTAALNK